MANPHAPTFKATEPDFGDEPGSGSSDAMFFAKRKKRSNGMFYSAEGAGKSTAGQDTEAEAGKIDHALDDLTDIKHRDGYAALHKEATFSSAAKAGTVGALVGAAAGFAGGTAASDEKNKKQLEEAVAKAKGSEGGKAVASARETVGHIGRAGADAAQAAKRELDKHSSDAAFDELEKSAGFLSMPGKGGVGKAVLKGLGLGGLGVGGLGMAAGAGGSSSSPLLDMQSGKVDVSGSPALSYARDTAALSKKTYFPGAATEKPTATEKTQKPVNTKPAAAAAGWPPGSAESAALSELQASGDPVLAGLAGRRADSAARAEADKAKAIEAAKGEIPMTVGRGDSPPTKIKLDTQGRTPPGEMQARREKSDAWHTAEADKALGRGQQQEMADFELDPDPAGPVEPKPARRQSPAPVAEASPPERSTATQGVIDRANARAGEYRSARDAQADAEANAPYGIQTRRSPIGTPKAEPAAIEGPGAMLADRGPAPEAQMGDRPGMDWEALAETQFGSEIDREYPGLDPDSRFEMLLRASQEGKVPGSDQRAEEYAARGSAGREGYGNQVLGDSPSEMVSGMAGRRPGGPGQAGSFDEGRHEEFLAWLRSQGVDVPDPAAMVAGK